MTLEDLNAAVAAFYQVENTSESNALVANAGLGLAQEVERYIAAARKQV